MTDSSTSFPWRAEVQKGCKGTIRMQRWDQEHYSVPATVLYHRPQRNGRDVIWVQHDAVSEDEKTISRNIVGFTEECSLYGVWTWLVRPVVRGQRGGGV